jgi:ParB-like chromosome segregation protein Spo0J
MYSGYYDWHSLFQSIMTNGYLQKEEDRNVEVCIGRDGEYLFVDGRHRLAIAQYLKIKEIPVDIVYQHQNIK